MKYNIKIIKGDWVSEDTGVGSSNLLEYLHSYSINIDSPCGGKGTCGKCKVRIIGAKTPPTDQERKLLGSKAIEKGYRLACQYTIDSNIEVYIDDINEEANIITVNKEKVIKLMPIVSKVYVELDTPNITDQRSDLERVTSSIENIEEDISVEMIKELPELLRSCDFNVTLVIEEGKIKAVEPGDTTKILYGVAVDIGTTTIAAYLYDLITGKRIGVYSRLNPQKKFGGDVLSRIEYTGISKENSQEMNKVMIDCINGIIESFENTENITKENIYIISFAGNTSMMHFLMDISAKNISVAPFIPVTTDLHKIRAKEIGIKINNYGLAALLPSVSGYVGGDIVAGILSTDMHLKEEISLLIDIGTNGEIVLGNKDFLYSCSAAAGPAFEGANIKNGIGGIKGAVDKVYFGDTIEYTTIGNEDAKGICGSGIIDIVSEMLKKGIIDDTGRIADDEEAERLPAYYQKRLTYIEGQRAFILTDNQAGSSQNDIVVTQKDIREIQNAKAAIAAGIISLVKHRNMDMKDIDKVYLAGGFGNYINTYSAATIGLIPSELKEKIESIGNSSGAGAVECILSEKSMREADMLRKRVEYIELSSSPDFSDQYVENMFFE